MPYPHEHSARLLSPDHAHIGAARTSGSGNGKVQGVSIPASIDIIWYIVKSGDKEAPVAQALRFPKDKFTEAEARAWLSKNEIKPISFEPAAENKDSAENIPSINIDEMFPIILAVFRFDVGSMPDAKVTPEGYIRGNPKVTRTGIFLYKNEDGTTRRELRTPEEVFKKDSLESMKLIPITNGHPAERKVDCETARRNMVGATGENINQDGDFVRCPVLITHKDGVDAVKGGRTGFSLGYNCDLIPEKGKFNGEDYDFRQSNIKYNHLALVDVPRAGEGARLRLDEADVEIPATKTDSKNETAFVINTNQIQDISFNFNPKKGGKMPQVILDGISYEAGAEIANALKKTTEENLNLREKLDGATKDNQKLTGERDAHKATADQLKARLDSGEDLRKAVAARIELEQTAAKVFNADEMKDISKKSDKEIRVAVIAKENKALNLDGKSDEYVSACFDTIVANLANRNDTGIDEQKKKLNNDGKNQGTGDEVKDARARMISKMTNKEADKK